MSLLLAPTPARQQCAGALLLLARAAAAVPNSQVASQQLRAQQQQLQQHLQLAYNGASAAVEESTLLAVPHGQRGAERARSGEQCSSSGRASAALANCSTPFALHGEQRRALFSLSSAPPQSKKFSQRRLVGWTPEQLYAVVSDVDEYSKFVPWCQRSVVTKRTGDNSYIEAELEVGFQVLVERYVSQVTLRPGKLVQSKVHDSMLFHHLDSTWSMEAGPAPNTCWLNFHVDFAFNNALYGHLADVFFSEVVQRMVSAFESRCHQLYGASSLVRPATATTRRPTHQASASPAAAAAPHRHPSGTTARLPAAGSAATLQGGARAAGQHAQRQEEQHLRQQHPCAAGGSDVDDAAVQPARSS